MNRKWLKYLAPVFALVFTALLLIEGHQQEREIEGWGGYGAYDGPPPSGYEFAKALNLPAVLAAAPGALLLASTLEIVGAPTFGPWQGIVIGGYLSLFVVAQWVFIGRWLGRAHKPIQPATKRLGLLLFVHAIGILFLLCCACWGVVSIERSGWMSSWISGAGLIAWSIVIATFVAVRIHRLLAWRGARASWKCTLQSRSQAQQIRHRSNSSYD